jgi:hypothetical protein
LLDRKRPVQGDLVRRRGDASDEALAGGAGMKRHPLATFQLSAMSVTGEPSAATLVLFVSTVAPDDLAAEWPETLLGVPEEPPEPEVVWPRISRIDSISV